MRKIASLAIGVSPAAGSSLPIASYWTTLPWRATSSTAPGIFLLATSSRKVALMRPRRSDDMPTDSASARGRSRTCAVAETTNAVATSSSRAGLSCCMGAPVARLVGGGSARMVLLLGGGHADPERREAFDLGWLEAPVL